MLKSFLLETKGKEFFSVFSTLNSASDFLHDLGESLISRVHADNLHQDLPGQECIVGCHFATLHASKRYVGQLMYSFSYVVGLFRMHEVLHVSSKCRETAK